MDNEKEEQDGTEWAAQEGRQDPQAKPQLSMEELEARLAKAESDASGYFAQLQRTMADFDNYRKRVLKEREELAKSAAERIILDIIEPVENLDRALESARNVKGVKKLHDGLEMTRAQIWSALERHGLRRIETVGTAFDPRWHEAVEMACDDERDDGTVVDEICSGYVLNGRVLRCAKVKVSKKSTEEGKE